MNIRSAFYFAIFSLIGVCTAHAKAVRMEASDIIASSIAAYLKPQIDEKAVECISKGSFDALAALKNGTADIAILAIPDDQTLPEGFDCKVVAFDVATVVVNENNPLKEINISTLSMILAKSTASADRWAITGLKDPWNTKTISIYLPDASNGITCQLLRNYTVKGGRFSDSVTTWTSDDQVQHIVNGQSNCLVVIRGNKIPGGGRALGISARDGDRQYAYTPTQDSVFYGDYIIRLPFYVVTRKDAPDSVKFVAGTLFSDAAAEKFANDGFISLPKSERE
jgi:hypothetical protein